MELFELATRKGFRFPSIKGDLNIEQLWDLPLTSKTGFDLDNVAKSVNSSLKTSTEESFVSTTKNPNQTLLEQKLDLVKYIISVKLKEAEERKQANEKAAKRAQLLELLAKKQTEKLESKSEEEILAELQALSN